MSKKVELQDIRAIATISNDIVLYGLKGQDFSKIETNVVMVKFAPYIGKPIKDSFQRFAKFSPYELVTNDSSDLFLVNQLYNRLPNEVLDEIFKLFEDE